MSRLESAPSPPPSRFLFIDGLRGLAAMGVVVYHFHGNLRPAIASWAPHALSAIAELGRLGVDVFFVISGFVIVHSVRRGAYSLGYLARFGLRRSIRLDPPLWATIGLEVAAVWMTLAVFPEVGTRMPTTFRMLTNVTYTQGFLAAGDVVPVFWSLTYEVQFYLVLVLALTIWQWSATTIPPTARARVGISAVLLVSFGYSLVIYLGLLDIPVRGLFIDRWFQFALGIGAWLAVRRHVRRRWLYLLIGVSVALVSVVGPPEYRFRSTLVALLTAGVIMEVGSAGRLSSYLSGTVMQFLGRISYSLYLVHLVVGWRLISVARRTMPGTMAPWLALLVFGLAVAVSIASAWIMYRLLEAPSMRLARRVGLPARRDTETVSDAAVAPGAT